MEPFGKILRDTRKIKGLTQEAIADEIGLTKGHLSLVESGQRKLSEEQARRAGEILGVKDIDAWVFLATKASVIQSIQQKFPTQFNSLYRERKNKSNIFKSIVKASGKTKKVAE